MPETPDENVRTKIWGLPIDRFEAAVTALAELRDAGRILVFLTRRGTVKLIGQIEDYRSQFSARAKDESINLEQSKKAQDEIRRLTSVIVMMPDTDSILDHLEQFFLDDVLRSDTTLKEEYRKQQRAKIDILSRQIVTEEMRLRATRMATATLPCLEDLDFEIVSEREDFSRGRTIKDPFLRLRLRYSEDYSGEAGYLPYFLFAFESPASSRGRCFEFECDVSDIDLLRKRLTEAKQRFLRTQEPESEDE